MWISTFTVQLDHFSGYVVKDIRQKKDQFLIVQSDVIKNMMEKFLCVITKRVNRNAVKYSWLCSSGLTRINPGRTPIYKTSYFKDVNVLYDVVCEVTCNGSKKYYVDVWVCKGKMLLPEIYWLYINIK